MTRAMLVILLASLGLSGFFAYMAWTARTPGFTPISGVVKDFGTVKQGEMIDASFTLRNDFSKPVTIGRTTINRDAP